MFKERFCIYISKPLDITKPGPSLYSHLLIPPTTMHLLRKPYQSYACSTNPVLIPLCCLENVFPPTPLPREIPLHHQCLAPISSLLQSLPNFSTILGWLICAVRKIFNMCFFSKLYWLFLKTCICQKNSFWA